jgi:hypothetical protein
MANIQIYSDPNTLALAAAEKVIEVANDAVQERGVFSLALAGVLHRSFCIKPWPLSLTASAWTGRAPRYSGATSAAFHPTT